MESEAQKPETEDARVAGTFGFPKVWEQNDNLPLESGDATALQDQNADPDFWASILERSQKEEEARLDTVKMGRGVRRKATKV